MAGTAIVNAGAGVEERGHAAQLFVGGIGPGRDDAGGVGAKNVR